MEKPRVKIHLHISPVNILLASLVLSMTVFIGIMFSTYSHLHRSMPLENLQAIIPDVHHYPVEGEYLEVIGTYDRQVMCQLYDFKVFLEHQESGSISFLGRRDLITAPPANSHPGENLSIQLIMRKPKNLLAGRYSTKFEGYYVCKEGIFTEHKIQIATGPTFMAK
jgi:hypothetical protein